MIEVVQQQSKPPMPQNLRQKHNSQSSSHNTLKNHASSLSRQGFPSNLPNSLASVPKKVKAQKQPAPQAVQHSSSYFKVRETMDSEKIQQLKSKLERLHRTPQPSPPAQGNQWPQTSAKKPKERRGSTTKKHKRQQSALKSQLITVTGEESKQPEAGCSLLSQVKNSSALKQSSIIRPPNWTMRKKVLE